MSGRRKSCSKASRSSSMNSDASPAAWLLSGSGCGRSRPVCRPSPGPDPAVGLAESEIWLEYNVKDCTFFYWNFTQKQNGLHIVLSEWPCGACYLLSTLAVPELKHMTAHDHETIFLLRGLMLALRLQTKKKPLPGPSQIPSARTRSAQPLKK